MRQAKMGDRFNWKAATGAGTEIRWDILAGDYMRAYMAAGTPNNAYWMSHPTKKDTAHLAVLNGAGSQTGTTFLFSYWVSNTVGRDAVDYNVVRQDNSVQMLRDVTSNDARLVDVPEYNNGAANSATWHQMPAR